MSDVSRDELGDRMKGYEAETRVVLPAKTWAVVRVDGRAFHTYTRGLDRPFDIGFQADMDRVAFALVEEIAGAQLAYVQSDEVSVIFSDLGERTEPYFGGVIQKIASIAAASASATMTRLRPDQAPALFDARVFALPSAVEVHNYLVWRQSDCRRNAISMLAHHHVGKSRVVGVSTPERRELLEQAGVVLDDIDLGFRQGRWATRRTVVGPVVYRDKRSGELVELPSVERRRWIIEPAPVVVGTRLVAEQLGDSDEAAA